jgi:hypothetical protein
MRSREKMVASLNRDEEYTKIPRFQFFINYYTSTGY